MSSYSLSRVEKTSGWTANLPMIVGVVLVLVGAALATSGYHYQTLFTFAAIYLIAAIGLNVLTGYVGIISLAHGALVCIGAYTTAIMTVRMGLGFWWSIVPAMITGSVTSIVVGLPALRLSSWYFVLVTIALALAVPGVLLEFREYTGGFAGLVGIPSPSLVGVSDGAALLIYASLMAGALMWIVSNIISSRYGWALLALREGNIGAEAIGVSSSRVKLFAFAFCGACAGLAGALYASAKVVITPEEFSSEFSILFLFIVVLGGPARLIGPLLGVAAFYVLPEMLTYLRDYRLIVFGFILLLFSVFMPAGLAGMLHGFSRRGSKYESADIADPAAAVASRHAGPTEGVSLRADGIVKQFGGLRALDGVTIDIEKGKIHVIVGPNGSGKTTLLNVISGFYPADEGTVWLDKKLISGKRPSEIARHGVQRTFQTPKLLDDLSLLDNTCFGAYTRANATGIEIALGLPRSRREKKQVKQEALQLLDIVGLRSLASRQAKELTHGQRRLAEIARGLMAQPQLILLDEPAAGLSLGELDRLGRLLKEIRRSGITMVLVEHHVELVADVADTVTVLDRGRVLSSGTAAEVFADSKVVSAYMGGKP
jgi:branched-chain amino acid transport system permease protein